MRARGDKGAVKSDRSGTAGEPAIESGANFRFLPAMEPADVDHLQLKELFTYWCRIREGKRMPSRRAVRSRDITRHAPFLAVVELLRSDGMFRVLGSGRLAQQFWQFSGGFEDASLAHRYKLMRALMRHQAANRMPVTLRSLLPENNPPLAFALIALPLSEDGEEVSSSLIEVISWAP